MTIGRKGIWLAGAAGALIAGQAPAQIAVSVNDGKQPRAGESDFRARPDNLAVIDMRRYPPRVTGTVDVPASMIGPPTSVAMARDGSFAIVTAAQKADPADPAKFVLDNKVSLIDLADPTAPRLVQTVEAGDGASGVAINRAGTLALVAATGDGTISVFSIAAKRLTLVDTLQLDKAPGPVDIALSPDGKTAVVTQRRGNAIWRLAIDGTKVTDTGVTFPTGVNPYGSVFSRDGRYAYSTNLQGRIPAEGAPPPRGGRIGTVTAIDLRTNRIAATVEVGPLPEHVALSADGRYLAVVVVNGSAASPTSPAYSPFGLLKVYGVNGATLTSVAEAQTGQWAQGATWSDDGRTLLLQSAASRQIEVYRFDGKALVRDPAATLTFDTRPAAITTALSR